MGSPNRSSDRAQPTLSPSLFVSATSDFLSPHPVYPTQPRTTEAHLEIAFFTRVDSLSVDSIKGHSQVQIRDFLLLDLGSKLKTQRSPDVLCIVVMLVGYVVNWNSMSMDYKVLMLCKLKSIVGMLVMELCRGRIESPRTSRVQLICASFGITRLICASFGITRLICVSFGITRLIRASFGITRLMYAFYGTTRLFM
ncbi:hypothetical protein E5676_scaffold2510G00270 [Cucumis melo var. makuwa]|uniref:Ty3-gypsy retrotransposon protein n=1 Tax=Cucumis melo var. makuwa TaxID=1194695 RepID=A0A5D3BMC8_CUCMM|nr:hypothetical protein E6C27_scaffold1192G00260 [Cucumis melo var. makuwa]TYK00140.1 hypothetical protein E5676_scaffold2510G00270 [Cucumis melo var. makuwa]